MKKCTIGSDDAHLMQTSYTHPPFLLFEQLTEYKSFAFFRFLSTTHIDIYSWPKERKREQSKVVYHR